MLINNRRQYILDLNTWKIEPHNYSQFRFIEMISTEKFLGKFFEVATNNRNHLVLRIEEEFLDP